MEDVDLGRYVVFVSETEYLEPFAVHEISVVNEIPLARLAEFVK